MFKVVRKNWISSALMAASLAAVTPVQASQVNAEQQDVVLTPYSAKYDIRRGGDSYGDGVRELVRTEGGEWQLFTKTDISWFILSDTRELSGQFTTTAGHIQPIAFRYKRTGTGSDKSFAAEFRRERETVVNLDNGRNINVPWQDNLLDEASVVEQLRWDVAKGQTEFDYSVVNESGKPDEYRYARIGEETLSLPYGSVEAVKIKRVRDAGSSRETYYWFAPTLNYSLVKLQQIKEGDEQATLLLKSFSVPALTAAD
ncbi:DUF3108 domain-containing protein [Idiomarina tyrosinivorans]|uniref:DUF3108 domain-containing protein n=1 Tax=Idiomarina tyrosinivorans TaxID=1445662 RepID=A0A432ZLR2_9GAMM|nr:DUF3108 domain-containing protein [Idiomarina tyrosinivorans]RUO78926.1 DUF3108 domain-containing protein [Idiomarina tyrosinivorans]